MTDGNAKPVESSSNNPGSFAAAKSSRLEMPMRHLPRAVRLLALAAAVGGALAPLWARGAGDPTPYSNAPMVLVLNPGRGAVVGSPFRLQVHAASPAAGGAIASVAFTTNGTAPVCSGTAILPVNTRYDGGAGGAVYEQSVTLGAGSYTLRVCARNAAGTVEAPPVAVTVTAASGDGNLLVRDNANQLCTDCHALQSHTSQSTSNKYGSWAIACRDCHVPHGTRNIYLLGERITPPDVHGANAGGARDVRFSTTVGDSGVAGLATPTQGSFANADNTGPCQVCHTQTGGATARFRQSGNADTHFTGAATQNCATCHLHTKGFSGSCTTCHGDSSRVGEQTSPPIDTCGNTSGGRVGAHQAHLAGGTLSGGVNCADCHLNPPVGVHPTWASCDTDPAHHAIMTWGALSRTVLPGDGGTVTPTWDPATQSCSNYCHGDFKNGNRTNVVTWNGTAACGSCHGQGGTTPLPPAPHPQNSACGSCHSTGYTTSTVVAALHIDGRVDSANFSCHSCHGSAANDAPPIAATTGNANAIGAHQAHVAAGSATVTNGYACTVCHVDNGTTDMTHSNGTVDMAWTAPANQGTTPTWSATGSTCANYCHGTSTAQASWGGTGTTPNWLTVNGTYRACDACHGAPPPLNVTTHHPFNTACGTCHGAGYAAASVTGAAALGTHVNGAVDTSRTGCTRCHGDLTATGVASGDPRAAPGYNASAADTTGALVSTSVGVGAHRAHLASATFRSEPIACSECHSLPGDGDVTHATGGGTGGARATLSWGGLASNGSTFDARVLAYGTSTTNANGNTAGSCSNTYCHAPRLADTAAGLNLNPSWTGAGTVACGDCHGLPPVTSQHPVGATNCGGCHPGYTASSVNLTTHIDGSLQYTPTGCSACHGSSTRTPVASATALDSTGQNLVRASPPADSQGAQASARVGAHAQHVNQEAAAPALSNALACTNCHATPDPATYTLSPLSHVNNAPAVPVFGGIATTGGVNPGYAGGSCSSTYCHGNFPMGNGANPISWGTGTPSKLGCTACHGAPPPIATHHPQSTACGDCHGAGYGASTVNAATHVDGLLTLNADRTGCVACHGTPGRSGVTGADTLVAAAPPIGTRGETLASTRAVGAHEAHTNKAIGAVDAPRTCFECHGNYPADSAHADGTVAMVAGAGWNGTNLNCSNYCHGNTMPLGGGSNRTPSWSGGPTQGACGTCHGNPPQVAGSPHPNNPTCSTCHPAGYLQGSVAAAAFPEHIDNALDFNGTRSGCTSCHGEPARGLNAALATVTPVESLDNVRAMPPIDTRGNSTQANNGVGAHLRHVNDRSKPLLCAECHGSVPAAGNTSHADTVTTITFLVSELASGLNPATNPGAIVPPAPLNPVYAEDVNGVGTCSSVYCHGAGLPVAARGNNIAPAWNTTLDCNACHGEPPGDAYHRTAGNRTTCVTCHSQTTDATGNIATANGTHVNGFANLTIDGVNGCAACHGDATRTVNVLADAIFARAAPPRALDLSTARTTPGVGAHEWHVNGSRSMPMLCSECHGTDSTLWGQNALFSHADGTVQMVWGANATARGATPGTYTPGVSTTCSSTYCHGNFPGGNGTGATTAWTTNTASPQLGCTACHGNPPALTAASHHPRNSACATCHGTGYSTTTVVQATHVNGLFNVSRSGCTLCHGDNTVSGVSAAGNLAAPGVNANAWDVTGAFSGTAAIGAHAAHLTSTRLRAAIPCSECHAPVTDTEATGWLHATGTGTGGARATIAFGSLARTGGITTAAYAGSTTATVGGNTAGTCSNTYCHGNFPTYGSNAAISWTAAGPLGCTACHGAPPGGVHGAGDTNCGACHTGYSGSSAADWAVNTTDHMNGVQNVNAASCTACHGDNGATPRTNFSTTAPPRDRNGSVLVSDRGVGAHATHLRNDGRSAEVACGDCHAAPQGATGHNGTGNATVVLAGRAGAGATYSATNLNCSTTYCHGNFTYGAGTGATAAWNTTAGLPLGCGSCHGNPPVHPHPGNSTCSNCHGAGYSTTTVARASHVDGLNTNLTAGCTACHGDRAVAGASLTVNTLAAAPGETGAATSADTVGGILSSSPGVGAHRAHLTGTRFRSAPIACSECHALPPSNTDTSHGNDAGTGGARARLTFGALAETDTFEPRTTAYAGSTSGAGGGTAGSCSASYCHAPRSTDTAATVNLAPSWTGSIACGSCHGIPPVTPNNHSTLTTCSTCHGVGYATTGITGAALGTHMNGSLQVSINSCSACHGSTAVAPVASASGASFTDSFGNNLVRAAPPPVASAGGVAGVHLQHVNQAATAPAFSNALACINCHDTTPAVTAYAGGHTNSTLEVQWGSLASLNDTLTPAPYNDAANTCSSTYCHGNFAGGLNQQNLSWTTAGKLGCNTCHLSPPVPAAASGTTPASYHPDNTNCVLCHPSGYTASAVVTASHVDGANTFNATQLGLAACQQCHGQRAAYTVNDATNSDPNVAAAPGGGANGPDSHGNTAITAVGVGAHQSHVNPPAASKVKGPLHCTECHGADRTDRTHASGSGAPAASDWGTLANGTILGGASTSPSYASPTCSSTYCHGARFVARDTAEGRTGSARFQGSAPNPSFTTVLSGCGTCHGFPPDSVAGGSHEGVLSSAADCNRCHAETVSAAGAIIFTAGGLTTHIDGKRDGGVSNGRLACGGCHATLVAAMNNTTSGQMHHYVNNANAPTSATAYSTTQPGATTDTTRTCAMCHVDHDLFNANKGANLRSGLVAAPTATASDFSAGAGICTACHTTAQTKAYANGSGTTQTPVIGAAAFTASAHNYGVQSSFGTSNFTGNCVKCHSDTMTQDKQTSAIKFGLHDSTKSSMTDPLGSTVTAMKLEENFCFRCHSATTDTSPGGGPAKSVADRDTFGTAGAAMTAGSQNLFATMQKGTAGQPAGGTTTTTNTLYFKPGTEETPPGTLPTAHLSTGTDAFAGGTFRARSMSPYAATVAYESYDTAAVTGATGTQNWRRVMFVSPLVATGFTTTAAAWTINIYDREAATSNNARVRYAIYTIDSAGALKSSIVARANGGTEMPTTAAPGGLQAITTAAGSAVAVAAGDRIVVDLYVQTLTPTVTTPTMTLFYGLGAASNVVMPSAGTFTYTNRGSPASGRHDVGNAAYTGLHRPSPADETRAYIAANKHVTCTDCHDPHEAMKRATNSFGSASAAGTTTTLTDGTKAWTAGQWVGARLTIRSGARAWLGGTVTANTATGLTFTPAMATATAAGDQYILEWPNGSGIVSAAGTGTSVTTGRTWVANQWTGYTVYVMSASTGAVLSRTITGNTAAGVLTVNSAITTAVNDRYWIGLIANVNAGVSGVDVTTYGANWAAPTAFNPATTSAALPSALAEWQVCFKCHSSANGSLATWDSTFTDLALEFSPRNASYHPVVASLPATDPGANGSNQLAAARLINGWQPGQTMNCTDCHGADTAAPAAQGPHGSAIKYMLTGVNRAWPFTTAGATAGQLYGLLTNAAGNNTLAPASGTANGLFCMNCHPNPTTTNGLHTQYLGESRTQHNNNMACVACHVRVPHGGKVSRLIATSTAGLPTRYSVSGVTPILAGFRKDAAGTYAAPSAFFTNTATLANGSNCNTEHTAGTTLETW